MAHANAPPGIAVLGSFGCGTGAISLFSRDSDHIGSVPSDDAPFKFSELERAFHMIETKEDGIIKPLILL